MLLPGPQGVLWDPIGEATVLSHFQAFKRVLNIIAFRTVKSLAPGGAEKRHGETWG